jgi:hypothetical protein
VSAYPGCVTEQVKFKQPRAQLSLASATREAAEGLDDTFDPDAWAGVLTEILRPARPAVSGACEVHDIETLRLIRVGRTGSP